ncbi:MAG: RNA methyltransferase [Thermoanaerobaculia bacterium]
MNRTTRIYGFHPVHEALLHRAHEVRKVWILASKHGGRRREMEKLCGSTGVRVEHAQSSDPVWSAGAVHNGFAAELAAVAHGEAPHGEAARASATREASGKTGDQSFVVLAEDVQDPRNLGALLRVCEGAGAGRVLVRDRGSAPLSATAVKTSAGASEWLNVERIGSSAQRLEQMKKEGYWIYGLAAGGELPWAVDLTGPVVLCVGGEEGGLRQLTQERCDRLIGLPMKGHVSSLNLATAAAAVLYEAVRQRTTGKKGR